MLIGYLLLAQDDDSYMLGDQSYRPVGAESYDWRFGIDGPRIRPPAAVADGRPITSSSNEASPSARPALLKPDTLSRQGRELLAERPILGGGTE